MSSPLSTLGKIRRVPLPGVHSHGRSVPFKETPGTGQEAALMDDIISPGPRQRGSLAAEPPTTSRSKVAQRKSSINGSGLSDFELMSTTLEKLGQLERRVNAQTLDIQGKEKKISVLEEKLRVLQERKAQTAGSEGPEASGREEDLEKTCLRLQQQVWEMESFLNDYGMVWVGSSGSPQEEAGTEEEVHRGRHLWQPGASVGRDFHMNFDLVLRSVRDLNLLAGEGVAQVQATSRGACLAHRSPIPLALYSNGILLFNGPFRSYQDPSTQQCMQDLMDGYFPSELQKRFPDGVPFQVSDMREAEFRERRVGAEFPGEGNTVGGVTERPHIDGHAPSGAVHDTHHTPGRKLSMEQFLNKLPKMVIKAGKVIDIQSSLRTTMQGSSCPPKPGIVINTPALQDPRSPGDDVIQLRLRAEDGGRSFILRMLLSETIGQLRQYLDANRGLGVAAYDIIGTFPLHRYGDDSMTLLASGLTSNSTLLLRPRPQPH